MALVVDSTSYTLVINSADKISGTNNNATYPVNWRDFLPRNCQCYKVAFSFQTIGAQTYTDITGDNKNIHITDLLSQRIISKEEEKQEKGSEQGREEKVIGKYLDQNVIKIVKNDNSKQKEKNYVDTKKINTILSPFTIQYQCIVVYIHWLITVVHVSHCACILKLCYAILYYTMQCHALLNNV